MSYRLSERHWFVCETDEQVRAIAEAVLLAVEQIADDFGVAHVGGETDIEECAGGNDCLFGDRPAR